MLSRLVLAHPTNGPGSSNDVKVRDLNKALIRSPLPRFGEGTPPRIAAGMGVDVLEAAGRRLGLRCCCQSCTPR